MAPRHTQGCGGGGMSRDGAFSRGQQTKNWCVGFSFPPPAYAGIHPTLYLFGFRASALNSHSPPSLPGFDPGSGLRCFPELFGLFLTAFGLRGPPGGPPGAGASGALEAPGLLGATVVRMLGLVVGFAFFGLLSKFCLADPKFQYFTGLLQYRPGQGCSQDHGQKTPNTKVAGFRVTNNLVSHSKGERSPRRGSCPSTWRCSSRSTNSLGLHSTSKQWCE